MVQQPRIYLGHPEQHLEVSHPPLMGLPAVLQALGPLAHCIMSVNVVEVQIVIQISKNITAAANIYPLDVMPYFPGLCTGAAPPPGGACLQ